MTAVEDIRLHLGRALECVEDAPAIPERALLASAVKRAVEEVRLFERALARRERDE